MPDEISPKALRAMARARKHPRKCAREDCPTILNHKNRGKLCCYHQWRQDVSRSEAMP